MDWRKAQLLSAPFAGTRMAVQPMAHIEPTAAALSTLSRCELEHASCEHWSWQTPNRSHGLEFCRRLLERIEALGGLALRLKHTWQRRLRRAVHSELQSGIKAPLKRRLPLRLETGSVACAEDGGRGGTAP